MGASNLIKFRFLETSFFNWYAEINIPGKSLYLFQIHSLEG